MSTHLRTECPEQGSTGSIDRDNLSESEKP